MSSTFHGYPCASISNGLLHLTYLSHAGPRIVSLTLGEAGRNLMAEVPDIAIPTPHGDFHLIGGHRLWHAPEAFPRAYLPDNDGLTVEELPGSVRLTQPIEASTGMRKSMEITLVPDQASLRVDHRLENLGAWPVECAPWALTQMPLGGLAVFPQTRQQLDPAGLLPNRQLVLWPYTRLSDPRLSLNDDFVFLDAQPLQPPVKIGYLNRYGWLGYLVNDVFFVKRFDPAPDQRHVDFGCNSESYCNDRFIEIETVGPLTVLQPGEATLHTEHWELHLAAGVSQSQDGVRELIGQLGLPTD